jgi:hypothetical protein
MKLLNFNIVFHKNLYKSNTDGFTPDELRAWFTFVAVNEQIVKRDYEWLKDQNVIAEYELDHYNPAYQMLHYQQNSIFSFCKNKAQYAVYWLWSVRYEYTCTWFS